MMNKEIAERLRDMTNRIGSLTAESLKELADELDPPKPEPGTVVWWRWVGSNQRMYERTGHFRGDGVVDAYGDFHRDFAVECKPAHILAQDEVAVKVPPVSEWGYADKIYVGREVSRAERMEIEKELER